MGGYSSLHIFLGVIRNQMNPGSYFNWLYLELPFFFWDVDQSIINDFLAIQWQSNDEITDQDFRNGIVS